MRLILFSLLLLLVFDLPANLARAQADELDRDGGCSRWDQRPVLRDFGWPRAVHMGGRETSTSLAFAEALSLKVGAAISPIEIDRKLQKGETIEKIVTSLAKAGPCPLAEGPIDDVAFSRDLASKAKRKIVVPPIGCDAHPDRRLKPASMEVAKVTVAKATGIDAVISAGRIPIVRWQANGGLLDSPIEARRYSPTTDRCEWLIRQMNGPFCDKSISEICEDGAAWLPRDDVIKKIKLAWEIR